MDASGVSREDLGGGTVDKEGWYHFEIDDVKNDLGKLNDKGDPRSPCIVLQMTVLESVKGQSPAGSKLFHRIYVGSKDGPPAEGAIKSACRLGVGLGILVLKTIGDKDVPVSSWLIDRKTGKAPKDLPWQVVGFRDDARTAALTTTSFLTLVPRDTAAPLRISGDAGNPYAGPDQGLGTDPAKVPPVGTELTLIIARHPDAPALPPSSPGQLGKPGAR
jgi:hypothetical protein